MNAAALQPVPAADELLRVGELAQRMRASRTFIWAMRRDGFEMPGGRATLAEARAWLRANPEFRVNRRDC